MAESNTMHVHEKSSSSSKPVILCVDDDKPLLETLERLILRHLGREFDVELAESGSEGLEVLQEIHEDGRTVALIVSDQIMPGMEGDEFLIRAMHFVPETPKILLTGQADMEAVVNAINHARLFRYVAKPWEDRELLRVIREATLVYKQKLELERYRNLFHALNFAGQHISAQLDKCEICRAVAQSCMQTCSADHVLVRMYDCEKCDQFERERKVRGVIRRENGHNHDANVLKVPIYDGYKNIGHIELESVDGFDRVDVEAAEILAAQAAITRKTAGLYQELTVTTRQLDAQKTLLEKQHRDLTDSIVYACRIQQTILPERSVLDEVFPDNFVFYQPRNIVSGDFYYWTRGEASFTVAVCDCTGHGVPGAFVSLIAAECLRRALDVCRDPAETLDCMEVLFRRRMNDRHDTVDLAIARFDFAKGVLEYAGARRPLWLYRRGELQVLPAVAKSLGETKNKAFETRRIPLFSGDMIYLFTDGITDQFGGEQNQKFKASGLKALLERIHRFDAVSQSLMLEKELERWRGENEPTDDMLVLGLRYS
jgi:serine phosphatase RsbU (regulator of sigma subunit)/CheY-like chemotaxis protein